MALVLWGNHKSHLPLGVMPVRDLQCLMGFVVATRLEPTYTCVRGLPCEQAEMEAVILQLLKAITCPLRLLFPSLLPTRVPLKIYKFTQRLPHSIGTGIAGVHPSK